MKLFHVLDIYIGKIIFIVILITLSVLVSLSGIIKFVDQMKQTGQGTYDTFGAGLYTALNVPKDLQLFFPISALLGVLLGLWMLEARSELVIIQAVGFSRMQIVVSVMKMTIPLILLIVGINEWIAPKTDWIAQKYRKKAIQGIPPLSSSQRVWVKDGNEFTYIERVKRKNELDGIIIYTFDNYYKIESVCYATAAKFDKVDRLWKLSQAVLLDLTNPMRLLRSEMVSSIWKTHLTPDKLNIITMNPDILPISDLYKYTRYLKATGQDFKQFQLNMWKKIFHPLSTVVMMLMGLSLIFYPLPAIVPINKRVIAGISCGFIFHVLHQALGLLALLHDIPPSIGAILPSVIFFLISLCLLLKQ